MRFQMKFGECYFCNESVWESKEVVHEHIIGSKIYQIHIYFAFNKANKIIHFCGLRIIED